MFGRMGDCVSDRLVFSVGRDRERPYVLELGLKLPPSSVCVVEISFDRALLKWTEYPPDANHGFYIPAGVVFARLLASAAPGYVHLL